jgi:hypothetical protein
MISSIKGKNGLTIWSVVLVTLALAGVASADHKNAPAPASAPHQSAPSRPAASAPHNAPAQRPGANAQRPAGPSNRGPAGASNSNRGSAGSNNRGPGATNTNNRTQGGANNRGQAGANNRGPGAANANNRTQGGANNRGQAGANNRGQGTNANNRTQGGANNRGQAGANNRGQAGTNNRGGNANNRGPGAKGGPGGANRHQPAGTRQVAMKNGGHATFRKDGHVRSIQTKNGMRVNHGVHGGRRVEGMHNGRRVVAMGRHGGYSQRAYYNHGGRAYVQRTYYVGGTRYAYAYHSYYYGGYPYYGYAPAYYYGPAYYGWAYNPWPAPVYYNWGWAGQPWYGYYGPYWNPYPSYPTAAFWLTDYLIAANLRAAYEASAAAESGELVPPAIQNASSEEIAALWSTDPLIAAKLEATYGPFMLGAAAGKGSGTQMSPEVKQALADQMKQEIAAEQAAAKGGQKESKGDDEVPAALDPKTRFFVVSSDLDATTSEGEECSLSSGDVIERTSTEADDDHMVDATVKSSKKDDCAIGASVGVETGDLQEMHNHLRETMDQGLKTLAEKQGKDGIPKAPDTKTQAGEVPAPTADDSVENDLKQTNKEADQAEAEAQQSN